MDPDLTPEEAAIHFEVDVLVELWMRTGEGWPLIIKARKGCKHRWGPVRYLDTASYVECVACGVAERV